MANNNMFVAPIYGINNNSATANGSANAQYLGFPSQSILVRPVLTNSTFNGVFNGVTVKSVIQLLPSGTVVSQPQYFTDKTVAEIVTLANT